MMKGFFTLTFIVVFAGGEIMKDSVVGIDKGVFKPIRLKLHHLQEDSEIVRLAGSARRMRIIKKAIKVASNIVQDTVKVERLKEPLLFPRPCIPLGAKVFLRKNPQGKYKQFCEKSCVMHNITCSYLRDIVLPDSHMDDCYICNITGPNQRSFSGFTYTDAVVYIKVASSIEPNMSNVPIAAGGSCIFEPTARDRPTALQLVLVMDAFKSYVNIETLYGYHLYISTMVHEIVHGLGFNLEAQPYQRYSNGRPQTKRYANFPYEPVNYSLTQRSDFSDYYWTLLHYMANESLFQDKVFNNTLWYKGENYAKAARSFFGCDTLDGGPLNLKSGSHLDVNRVIGAPMSVVADEEMNPPGKLSSFTAAYLEDTGWYEINNSNVREPIGGTFKLGCKFAKFGCLKYKNRPCCSQSYPNDTEVFCARPSLVGKVLCLKQDGISESPMLRLWHLADELWQSVMPYCRYASWKPKSNILWEMSDLKKSFCFEPFDRHGLAALDLSQIRANQTSVVNANRLSYFSGCYKVQCVNESTYTVQAAFGPPQVCRSMGDKTMFRDGDKKVGPFKCWNIGLVCKKEGDDFKYAPITVPK